jgi:hypothetical protein
MQILTTKTFFENINLPSSENLISELLIEELEIEEFKKRFDNLYKKLFCKSIRLESIKSEDLINNKEIDILGKIILLEHLLDLGLMTPIPNKSFIVK